jgi:hypothetical protein
MAADEVHGHGGGDLAGSRRQHGCSSVKQRWLRRTPGSSSVSIGLQLEVEAAMEEVRCTYCCEHTQTCCSGSRRGRARLKTKAGDPGAVGEDVDLCSGREHVQKMRTHRDSRMAAQLSVSSAPSGKNLAEDATSRNARANGES